MSAVTCCKLVASVPSTASATFTIRRSSPTRPIETTLVWLVKEFWPNATEFSPLTKAFAPSAVPLMAPNWLAPAPRTVAPSLDAEVPAPITTCWAPPAFAPEPIATPPSLKEVRALLPMAIELLLCASAPPPIAMASVPNAKAALPIELIARKALPPPPMIAALSWLRLTASVPSTASATLVMRRSLPLAPTDTVSLCSASDPAPRATELSAWACASDPIATASTPLASVPTSPGSAVSRPMAMELAPSARASLPIEIASVPVAMAEPLVELTVKNGLALPPPPLTPAMAALSCPTFTASVSAVPAARLVILRSLPLEPIEIVFASLAIAPTQSATDPSALAVASVPSAVEFIALAVESAPIAVARSDSA